MHLFLSHLSSPLGELLLVTDPERRIRALDFADHESRLNRGLRARFGDPQLVQSEAPEFVAAALRAYFAGQTGALSELAIAPAGDSLQGRVWNAVRQIPDGKTTSYGALARELGFADPRAAIEIGAAVGSNPIAIIIPCHRVVASNGDLKGFAWGLHRKRWLLEHEKAIEPPAPQTASFPGF
ncbi:methylated-DNA--[protein]-cysteine S-methyltransferase [Pseudomonas sp. NPDC089396]|uniref:methylated-DNA--[protein]-cysteine S-methyltransferase n=1 Tax=Pseudomonas sp. NPDC089396 TaxID=3364461 RepID=UPI003832DDC2